MIKEVRKKVKAAKEERTEEQCMNTENGMMSENSKEIYSSLNQRFTSRPNSRSKQSLKTAVETS